MTHALLNQRVVEAFRRNLPRIEKAQAKRINKGNIRVTDVAIRAEAFDSRGACDEVTPRLRMAMDKQRKKTMARRRAHDEEEFYNSGASWRKGEGVVGGLKDDKYSAHDDEGDWDSHQDPRITQDPDIEEGWNDNNGTPEFEEDEDIDEEERKELKAAERRYRKATGDKSFKGVGVRRTGEDEPPPFPGRPRPGGQLDSLNRSRSITDYHQNASPAKDTLRRFPEARHIKSYPSGTEHLRNPNACPTIAEYMARQNSLSGMSGERRVRAGIAMDAKASLDSRRQGNLSDFYRRFPNARGIKQAY
jgi:hypothetical protein